MGVVGTVDLVSDTTAKEMVEQLKYANALRAAEAAESLAVLKADLKGIQSLVRKRLASQVFEVGDQIVVPWTDKDATKTYQVPMDIVHFGDVTLKDGEVVPGMFLQWHYATPYGVMFDAYEAFYYAEEELPAGTYYITVGDNWGTYCKKNETYSFTLTSPVPTGGQLSGFKGMPDQAPTSWKVYSWASKEAAEPIETVSVTAGANGTSLGTLQAAGNEQLNSLHRTAYGYNRWSQSAIRQYLNSAKEKGEWWKPQNNYDRMPDQLSTKTGFLAGFEKDFLDVIGEVKVTTALNTVTDASVGAQEDTYDKIFLPSLEQLYLVPQLKGAEGDYWEYWKRATGATEPQATGKTYPERITYAIEARTSAQCVRLRSAYRGLGTIAWIVNTSGHVNGTYAHNASRCAPACVIC